MTFEREALRRDLRHSQRNGIVQEHGTVLQEIILCGDVADLEAKHREKKVSGRG